MLSPKGLLMDSERLGPSNEAQIKYSVRATAGKQIRFNVRDSVNPSCEGSAFTDVIAISELQPPQDETDTAASGGDKSCFAAFSSQLSLASSMASSSATARNEDSSSNGNTPNTGLVLEVSYVLVFGSLVGILGAYILTTWQSETHKVWAL
jgi:hypothetical protein